MKKNLHFFIISALLLCEALFFGGGMAFAATTYTLSADNKTLTITNSGAMDSYTSSNYTTRGWQSYATTITKIIINHSVTSIGAYAFYEMSAVTEVQFGTSSGDSYCCAVTSIGNSAFDGCTSLAKINCYGGIAKWLDISLGNNASNPLYKKGGDLYVNGTKQTSLTISSGTSIGARSFYKNTGLTSVSIGSSITSIGENAFCSCSNLATVKFGTASSTGECNISTIGNGAFSGCSNLTSVYCYGGIAKWLAISFGNVGSNPFCATSSTKTQYFYLNGTSTSSITIPYDVTEIKAYAFYNNRAITTLNLGTNSTTQACSVNNICTYAFYGCTNLTTINCYGGITKWLNIAFADQYANPFYPTTSTKTFKLDNSAVTAVIIPDDVTEVKAHAFYNNTAITSLTIGTGLKNIRTNAFYNCTNLAIINFNATNCADLSSSTYAFNNAGTAGDGITLNIGSGVNVIPGYLFYPSVSNGNASSRAKLTSVVFADESSCSTIKNYAFAYTNQLTSIRLPSIITAINSSAFTSSALTSTYFDGTVKQWCNITFGNMSANPVYISQNLYINNELVENLVIPSDVDIIKAYAFYNDTSITSVHIPTSITNIASDAFNNCKNIVKTQYAGSPKQWSSITFGNKNSNPMYKSHNIYLGSPDTLTTYIYMPDDLDAIKDYAFAGNTTINEISIDPSTTPANSAFDECSANIVVRGALNGYCGDKTGGDGTNLTWILDEGVLTISGLGAMESYSSSSKQPWYGYRNSITSIVVEAGVTTLGNNFAYGSVNATSVSLPGTLTTVGNYVFQSCTSLKAVSFPASVTSLGTNVLYGCSSLEYIIVARTESVTTLTTTSPYTSRKIYVPYSILDTYKAATKWSDLASNIYPYTGSCGTSATWTYSPADSTLTISGTGEMANYSTNGSTAPWYALKNMITKIVVEEGVSKIGSYAFYGYTTAREVYVPSTITAWGTSTFYNCSSSSKFYFGGTLAQWCGYSFGARASCPIYNIRNFYINNEKITELIIPDGVKNIGSYAFSGGNYFTSISLPASLETVSSEAFDMCNQVPTIIFRGTQEQWCAISFASFNANPVSLSTGKSLTIADTIVTYIYLPDTFPAIGNRAFYKNTTLVKISLSSNTTIGTDAFRDCTAELELRGNASGVSADGLSWSLVDSVLTISGTGAMTAYTSANAVPWYPYRSSIREVIIEDGVTTVGKYAFNDARKVKKVTLPPSISSIGDYSFQNCISIDSIICESSSVPTVYDQYLYYQGGSYISYAFENVPTTAVVNVPIALLTSFKTAGTQNNTSSTYGWRRFTNYHGYGECGASGDNLKFLYADATGTLVIYGSGTMADYADATAMPWNSVKASITTLVIGDEVTSIGKYAFAGSGITSLNDLPSSLTSIGYRAFENSTALASITIPRYVTKIGDGMVINSSNLTTVVWNAENCTKVLKSDGSEIAMSSSWNPFYGTTPRNKITSFTFGENVAVIPNGLCSSMNNEAFTSITIPSSVTSVGANAFDGCTNIATVTSNAASVPSIASSTFPTAVEDAATLYVPATVAVRMAYSNDTYWSEFDHMLPYVLTFNLQEHGDAINPICVNAGRVNEELKPADPTEEYYNFGGWYQEAGCSTPFTFGESGTVVNADKTIYAKWTIYNYQVTFDMQGHGASIATQTIDHNGLVSQPSTPSETGYTFGGWFKEAGCSNAWNFSSDRITAATTLYAKWTINSYDVTFDLQGHGDAIDAQSVNYNGLVSEPTDPSAEGFTFGGWFKEAGCSNAWDFSNGHITAATTLYAKWTENIFSFADTDTDNSNIAAAEGKKASSVTIGRTVWKDGYYNTLCLPFSLSANEIETSPLAGYKALKRLSTATVTGTGENRVLNIQLEPITAITAGEPFLISYEAGENITNPVFNNVTVTAATPGSIHAGDVTCHGIYARTNLGDANTNLFLGTNNTLYWPQDAEHSTMNGLRAYFSIDSSGPAYAGMRVRLTDKPAETPTGIDHDAPSTEPQSTKILRDGVLLILRDGKTYSAQGVRIQ